MALSTRSAPRAATIARSQPARPARRAAARCGGRAGAGGAGAAGAGVALAAALALSPAAALWDAPAAQALEVKSLFGKQKIQNKLSDQDQFAQMKAEAAAKNKAAGGEEIKLPESSLTCPEGSYLVMKESSAEFYCATFGADEASERAADELAKQRELLSFES